MVVLVVEPSGLELEKGRNKKHKWRSFLSITLMNQVPVVHHQGAILTQLLGLWLPMNVRTFWKELNLCISLTWLLDEHELPFFYYNL